MNKLSNRRSGLDLQVKYAGMVWLLAAQVVVMLPFMTYLPAWLILVLLTCTAWRLRVLRGHWESPPRWLKGALLMLGMAALAISGLDPFSLDTMSSLLLLAFAFKSLEITHRRDALVVVFTGYFLVAVQFLFNQSIGAALYGIVCLTLLTAALLAIQESPDKKVGDHIKLAGSMLLQCLPLMIIIYLFFPRLPPLWAVSLPTDQATTGISDQMAPGDIASLSQSDATAFRVAFNGARPDQNQLYWRGLVLSYFDGRTWTQFASALPVDELKQVLRVNRPDTGLHKDVLEYEVIYEKTRQNWLFTLPSVVNWEGDAVPGFDYRLMAKQALNAPAAFTVFSDLELPRDNPLTPALRRLTLGLPQGQNLRAQAMAVKWRERVQSDKAYANRLMSYFRTQPFFYTLRPPVTGTDDTIDQFMFESRRGFCSHYAGSFVYMMRAAGIPARVVIGYQGGEWNEQGDFLTVREYDAHAWAEIWLDGEGWVRFDPTAMVAPQRVEQNLQAAVEGEGSFLEESTFSPVRISWLDGLRQKWDAVQYGWRRWVLGYDTQTQSRWLESWMGEVTMLRVALVFGVLFSSVLLTWLLVLGYFRVSDSASPGLRLYRKLCYKLEKQGLKRPPESTPGQFALMAASKLPEKGTDIREATQLYEALTYGAPTAEQEAHLLARFKAATKRI